MTYKATISVEYDEKPSEAQVRDDIHAQLTDDDTTARVEVTQVPKWVVVAPTDGAVAGPYRSEDRAYRRKARWNDQTDYTVHVERYDEQTHGTRTEISDRAERLTTD